MADRTISWSLGTLYKNGAYNSTFDFNILEPAYNLVCEYFQLRMPRQRSGGNFRVLQSNVNKNNWAAWTTGSTIYISPTFNFGRDRRRCSKVAVHEFGHFTASGHSNDPEALMSADGGTSQGWVQDDMRWFGRHKLRGAMPPRGVFATRFGAPAYGLLGWQEERTPLGIANGVKDRFRDYFARVYEIKKDVHCDKG